MQWILIINRICATSLIWPKNQFAFAVEITSITTTQQCYSDSQTLLRYVSILRRWFSYGFFFYKLFPILSGCFLFWFQRPLTKGRRRSFRELGVENKTFFFKECDSLYNNLNPFKSLRKMVLFTVFWEIHVVWLETGTTYKNIQKQQFSWYCCTHDNSSAVFEIVFFIIIGN